MALSCSENRLAQNPLVYLIYHHVACILFPFFKTHPNVIWTSWGYNKHGHIPLCPTISLLWLGFIHGFIPILDAYPHCHPHRSSCFPAMIHGFTACPVGSHLSRPRTTHVLVISQLAVFHWDLPHVFGENTKTKRSLLHIPKKLLGERWGDQIWLYPLVNKKDNYGKEATW